MKKTKIAVLITIAVLFLYSTGLLLIIVIDQSVQNKSDKAKNGVIYLGKNLLDTKTAGLDGEWEFYWKQLLAPDDFTAKIHEIRKTYKTVPGKWDGYGIAESDGYATYRLIIKHDFQDEIMGINIKEWDTSYKIWINGKFYSEVGRVAETAANFTPKYKPQVIYFKLNGTETEIVIQTANFAASTGGIRHRIKYGKAENIQRENVLVFSFDQFLVGVFLIIAIYLVSFFMIRRKEKTALVLGLFCIGCIIRMMVSGEDIVESYLLNADWELIRRIDMIFDYCLPVLFFLFLHNLFPNHVKKWTVTAVAVMESSAIIITLLTEPKIFTWIYGYYLNIVMIFFPTIFFSIIKAVIDKQAHAKFFFTAWVIITFSYAYDMMVFFSVVTPIFEHNITFFVIQIFLLIQTFAMIKRFITAFNSVEKLSKENENALERIKELNVTLEHKVNERTFQLNEAKDTAERASRIKSEFMANMSHEIRTPIHGIAGFVNILKMTDITPEQSGYIGKIKYSMDYLLSIVNDILDYEKIVSGKIKLENRTFNICDTVESSASIFAAMALEKKIDLIMRIKHNPNIMAYGDEIRIKQVITNLISNAVKFTEIGYVYIESEVSCDKDKVYFKLIIKDTGIGIAHEKTETIFEAFEQADISASKKYTGTGLGLAISKKLIELMGGKISVFSKEKFGSTFSFIVELKRKETDIHVDKFYNTGVLVVDCNELTGNIIAEYVEEYGFNAYQTESTIDAVKILEEMGGKIKYVITAENMPVMSGMGLYKWIKGNKKLKDIEVIMTGMIGLQKKKEVENFLLKPIGKKELYKMFKKLNFGQKKEEVELITDEIESMKNKSILIVDDNDSNRMMLLTMLKKIGFEKCSGVENGVKAIKEASNFDIIFMDCHMPDINGFDATEAIRKTGGMQPRIIALTASIEKKTEERCYQSGMDGYITKPVSIEDIIHSVKGTNNNNDKKHFNSVTERTGLNDNEIQAVYNIFTEDLKKYIPELKTGISNKDYEEIEKITHKLKGVLANFGMEKAGNIIREIEVNAKDKEIGRSEELVERFIEIIVN